MKGHLVVVVLDSQLTSTIHARESKGGRREASTVATTGPDREDEEMVKAINRRS